MAKRQSSSNLSSASPSPQRAGVNDSRQYQLNLYSHRDNERIVYYSTPTKRQNHPENWDKITWAPKKLELCFIFF
uniref:Ribosomal protein L33 n=1 Tax=Panagrolaimus sp. ES5 TaxID=591445 RepID=A0AC34GK23_9BILA